MQVYLTILPVCDMHCRQYINLVLESFLFPHLFCRLMLFKIVNKTLLASFLVCCLYLGI